VLDYAREGYLPEVLVSFMATLGWNDGTEQEIFTVDELIQKFSLDRVQKNGARFDKQHLLWVNGTFIRQLPPDDLHARAKGFWPAEAASYDDAYKKQVLALVQERLKFFAELPQLTEFFFKDLPVNPALWEEHKQLKKLVPAEIRSLLKRAKAALEQSDFSANDLTEHLNNLLEQTGQNRPSCSALSASPPPKHPPAPAWPRPWPS